MADYRIGDFVFSYPLWIVGSAKDRDDESFSPLTSVAHALIGDKKCCPIYTDEDLAERASRILVESGQAGEGFHYVFQSVDSLINAIRLLKILGACPLAWDQRSHGRLLPPRRRGSRAP